MAESRKPPPASPAASPPGSPAAPASPPAPGEPPRRRTGPLPSLAELGAFDGPAPKPRLSSRLSEADLKGRPAAAPSAPVAPPVTAPVTVPVKPPVTAHVTPSRTTSAVPPVTAPLKPAVSAAPPPPAEPPPEPAREPGTPPGPQVTGVTVSWADLNAAAEAGWMDPAVAHALWARWLARKPLTRTEEDSAPLPSWQGEPLAAPGAAAGVSAPPEAAQAPTPAPAPMAPPASAGAARSIEPEPEPARTATSTAPGPSAGPEPARAAETGEEPPATGASASSRPEPHPEPDTPPPEVLEPTHEYEARRAAQRAADRADAVLRPTVQVVDVIEVPSLNPVKPPAAGWVVGQYFLAMLAAAGAALSIGLGSTLFGPWGAAAAAVGWTVFAWLRTAAFHGAGQRLRAVLAAHVTMGLVAASVWAVQEALGLWPAARAMDLFADAPERLAASARSTLQMDGRWLALAALPLAAGIVWMLRLRHVALLGTVTVLLWGVVFQVVAGVLSALGLAFHGLDAFAGLLGAMTVAAAFYIDLVSRRGGVQDYARWPYLLGAVLLGAGWLSAATLPPVVQVLRGLGWITFVVFAVSLARPGMVAVALAFAGFELAWTVWRATGSDLAGLAAWAGVLVVTGGLMAVIAPRLRRWAPPLRFWMPRGWRDLLASPQNPNSRTSTDPA